ncbi:MAG: hypothetical protein MI739_07405 [Bacteroidales bacterium]|nr:hypothetical protein [Bacteroidales bacterium]
MDLIQRIDAFVKLGLFISNFVRKEEQNEYTKLLNEIVQNDCVYNPWFTPQNILQALDAIAKSLDREKINSWISKYPKLNNKTKQSRIGVVTAGNIPLVGFHDFLTILISGDVFVGKLSSKDNRLLKFISQYLISLNQDFEKQIVFCEDKLTNFDAVIATGNNNTARYFEYYFGKYPHIIRKNRSSVAVLTGNETSNELQKLGIDIFSYFGLGCRNVSKLFVPQNYSFEKLFTSIDSFQNIYKHNKYANNYDYNRSIYLMNQIRHFDNGFALIKESKDFSSPIGVIYFEYYQDIDKLNEFLDFHKESIQCIVSCSEKIKNALPLGKAQSPELWDYADNIDTLNFISSL